MKLYFMPQPCPKNSPMGLSTLGCSCPSQYIRKTRLRRSISSLLDMVTQMCLTIPAPAISAMATVSPFGIFRQSAFPPERS